MLCAVCLMVSHQQNPHFLTRSLNTPCPFLLYWRPGSPLTTLLSCSPQLSRGCHFPSLPLTHFGVGYCPVCGFHTPLPLPPESPGSESQVGLWPTAAPLAVICFSTQSLLWFTEDFCFWLAVHLSTTSSPGCQSFFLNWILI